MSALQLNKVKSSLQPKVQQNKCYVFFHKDDILNKQQFSIDDETIVKEIIQKIVQKYLNHSGNTQDNLSFELYAGKRDGRIVSDLPSFDKNQSVLNTKQKYFYLKEKISSGKSQQRRSTNITSISCEMKLNKKSHQEILPKNI